MEKRKKEAKSLNRKSLKNSTQNKEAKIKKSYQESGSIYKKLVESSLQGIVIAQGIPPRLVYANPAISRILGYSPDELTSLTFKQTENLIHPDDRLTFFSQYKDRLEGKSIRPNYEIRAIRKDGSTVWLELSATQIEYNSEPAVLATYVDITERKKAKEALAQSEERYRTLVEESFDGIFIQKGFKIVFTNHRLQEMLGYKEDELEGLDHWIVYHPDYQALTRGRAQARMRGESVPPTYEVKFLRKDGSSFWGEIHAKVISFLGEPGIQVWARDITGRKQAEETLHAERERFRSLSENAPFGMAMIDKDGTFQYINPKFKELFGYDLNDVPDGKTWFRKAYPDPDYRHQVISAWLNDLKSSKPEEKRARIFSVTCKDGAKKIINFLPVQLETGEDLMACEDITDHKRAEEEINHTLSLLNATLESTADGILVVDSEGKIESFNRKFVQMWHIPESIIASKDDNQALAFVLDQLKDPDSFLAKVKELYSQPAAESFDLLEFKDGRIFERYSLPQWIGEQSVGRVWSFRDVTERKWVEEALGKSEGESKRLANENAVIAEIGRIISSTLSIDEVYKQFGEEVYKVIPFDRILINIVDPEVNTFTTAYVMGVDVDGRPPGAVIQWHGSATQEVFHSKSSLLIQENDINELADRYPALSPHFQAGFRSFIAVPLFSKTNVIGVLHFQSIESHAYSEKDLGLAERVGNQIAGAIANARLFKERMQAEEEMMALQEQLRQSQKMEAIGQLAGGIAHDFNNLLTVIKGYAQLSLLDLKEGGPLKGNIEEIQKASQRAADLTRQLLAFSRRQMMEMKVLDLNVLLKDLDKMLRRVIGEDIDLVTMPADDLGGVKTDPGQIEQVIMNLAVNARDAMPNGGKLTIETANVELDEAYARAHIAVAPGRYVMLSISDTGMGMTPDVKERIFEPFFTTKEKGKGTGLGLSTVYGIVKQSGGNIWVYSEPGQGTTFKIYLPRVDELPEEMRKKEIVEEIPQGSKTILLVEDDEALRKLSVIILETQGYKVLEAGNGNEALRLCGERKEPIHLILTDVVMPEMSGRELTDRFKFLYPETKVLYMSGYTDNTIVHHGVLVRGVNFIQKPFTPEALARKVREVLDR